jgi:hypothetical protein
MDTVHMQAQRLGRREVIFGLLFGLCALVAIAVFLSIVDPYLRDPAGAVFSISALLGKPF